MQKCIQFSCKYQTNNFLYKIIAEKLLYEIFSVPFVFIHYFSFIISGLQIVRCNLRRASSLGISNPYVSFCRRHRCRETGTRKVAADSSNRPSNENMFLPDSRAVVFVSLFDVASHCSD